MEKTTKRVIIVTQYNRESALQEVTNADGSNGVVEREKFQSRYQSTVVVQGIHSKVCGYGYILNGKYVFKSITGDKMECEHFYSNNEAPFWNAEVGVTHENI